MLGRQTSATLILLCVAAVLEAQGAIAQPEDFHFIPGTFNTRLGPDGNTEIYTAPSGLVVIDTGRHPAHAQAILDYATSQGLPVIAVINTHWHFDHTTGNLDMKAAYPDVDVYATRAIDDAMVGFLAEPINTSREQVNDPNMDEGNLTRELRFLAAVDQGVVEPDIAVEATIALPVSGRNLELNVTQYAVSESDIWIWDPATRTVIAGDIVTLPAPFFDTGCVEGWVAAFDEIENKPYERVVPGHGYIMTAEEFRLYHKAFDNMIECAQEATGAECAQGWLEDAAPLLEKSSGEDYGDTDYAERAVTYYVDNIIRSPEKQNETCAAQD